MNYRKINILLRGQSLVEGLVALSMASIVLVAIISVVTASLSTSRISNQKEQANQLAQESMELVRSQRGLSEGFYCVGEDDVLGFSNNTDTCTVANIDETFIRKVEVIEDGCSIGVDNVTVSVAWAESSCTNGEFCQSVQLATCLDPSGLIGGNYPVPPTGTPTITPSPTVTTTPAAFTPTPTPVPPTLTFTASPTFVSYNGSSTLSWNSSHTTSCSASGAWSGSKPVSGSQSTGSLTNSRTYTLVCSGPGGSVTRSVTVSVASSPTPTRTPAPTLTPTPANLITTSGYLSDKNWASATIGWGSIQKDKSVGGNPITLNGVVYSKGLGTHANSVITYNISGCSRLTSDIGRDDESQNGTILFQVSANGSRLYDSGSMDNNTATKHVDVNLSGRSNVGLVVDNLGDGTWDHADWANAYIVCGNDSPPVTTNRITNGGFESGSSNWVGYSSKGYDVFCTNTVYPCSEWQTPYGNGFVYLGGSTNSAEYVYQTITIPSNATRASLSVRYRIHTTHGTSNKEDTTSISIYNNSGNFLQLLQEFSNQNHTNGSWRLSPTYNLLPYKGQTIRVRFGATNDEVAYTSFFYDEAEVIVSYVQ